MLSPLSFFGVFLLVGALVLAIASHRRLRVYRRAQRWAKVPATVLKASVREKSDSDGSSYRPEFSYRYSVAGTQYESGVHTEGLPFPVTKEAAYEMVGRFPVGSKVQVAVSPTDPSCAVLDTGFPKVWQALRRVSIVALVAGLVIVLVASY